jgi:hypothetical protein
MHQLLMAVLCWLLMFSASAQQNKKPNVLPDNEFYLKLNPFALLETDGGVSISGEYIRASSKLGFQLELQPVWYSGSNTDGKNGPEAPINAEKSGMPLGIEVRPEVRYYVGNNSYRRRRSRLFLQPINYLLGYSAERRTYIAIDLLYKHVQRERLGTFDVFNGGPFPAYTYKAKFTDVKNIIGANFKIGFVSSIFESEHWFLESYIGFGLRRKKFSYKNLPPDVSEPDRRQFLTLFPNRTNRPGTESINGISVPAAVKLVYRFR